MSEMYEAIVNYHKAVMGNDSAEIDETEKVFNETRLAVGEEEYQKQIDKFNEMIRSL